MDARSHELARARYMYVTTYSQAGKPGTVPTWLWPHEDAVYERVVRVRSEEHTSELQSQ